MQVVQTNRQNNVRSRLTLRGGANQANNVSSVRGSCSVIDLLYLLVFNSLDVLHNEQILLFPIGTTKLTISCCITDDGVLEGHRLPELHEI